MSHRAFWLLWVIIFSVPVRDARAGTNAFDLIGPQLEAKVIRGNQSLPISQVPDLRAGDRLWVHPLMPEDQAVRYLLVVAFLRGPTNPPPDDWFFRAETWSKKVREEGAVIPVPKGAEQAVLFLAPETGGDFSTLRSTVQGKPGAFVRATQELYRLSLDRSRLDRYIQGVEDASVRDPESLHTSSPLLARSLNIKLNKDCFDKPSEQQMSCLTANTDQLVLDDPHSQSMIASLTTGPSADLIGALGGSPLARGGYYSPYIGAVVDVARIMGNIHTARYQYIPALALPRQYQLNLRLNNPPSFRNPKSVLVIALPGVESAKLPPLRAVGPVEIACLEKSPLVLPVEGAPLVFSTQMAHHLVLHLETRSGKAVDVPAVADPGRGGLVVESPIAARDFPAEVTGTIQGSWGFEKFSGPSFRFRSAHAAKWQISSNDSSALIVGRRDTLHLDSDAACCVEQVLLKDAAGAPQRLTWRLAKADQLEVEMPLENAQAGKATLLVRQAGLDKPDEIPLRMYAEAAQLGRFTLNAGDRQGTLRGTRLDEVASLDLHGVKFAPAGLKRVKAQDELRLAAQAATTGLTSGGELNAQVTLKDGRVLNVETEVDAPRPRMSLLSKMLWPGKNFVASPRADTASGTAVVAPAEATPGVIQLGNGNDLPGDGQLSFVLKSEVPANFPRDEKIEVATNDGAFDVTLSTADGSLILQDAQTVLARFDAARSFGPSAFGPLRFRPVAADATTGDWQPLATLVRLPTLTGIQCAVGPGAPCRVSGTNLYLMDSVSANPQFSNPVSVPVGYVAPSLTVPRPADNAPLYFKLCDDPSAVNSVLLPVAPSQP